MITIWESYTVECKRDI